MLQLIKLLLLVVLKVNTHIYLHVNHVNLKEITRKPSGNIQSNHQKELMWHFHFYLREYKNLLVDNTYYYCFITRVFPV